MTESLKYWAFISYSHKDESWARWLQARLERIRISPGLSAPVPAPLNGRRLAPVFRDTEELAASSSLSSAIENALRASYYLVVVCSPEAAQSKWVNAEVDYFIGLGRQDRILLLVVGGNPERDGAAPAPSDPFPRSLKGAVASPLWVDARPAGDLPERAAFRIAAGILNVGFDALWQRERRRRRRRLTVTSVLLSLVTSTVLFLIYLQMRPTDLAFCPVNRLNYRDTWLRIEIQIKRSGHHYHYLCGPNAEFTEEADALPRKENCLGPFGIDVLHAEIKNKNAYFVYETIKGAPCCWWNSYNDSNFDEVTSNRRKFAWHDDAQSPRLGAKPYLADITFNQYSKTSVIDGLDRSNPLVASGCRKPFLSLGWR
jgi:hypothetical protein